MATKTITGIKAGQTTITASYTEGGVTKTASVQNFTVSKIAGSSGTVSNPASQAYKDGTQTNYSFQLGITGATGTVSYPTSITVKKGSTTVTGWTCNSSGVLTVPYTQGAGEYTVTGNITVAESDNYNAVGATSKTWTITITQKNDASVSVTLASNAGTYGSTATLVTAANSSSHGTSAAYIGYKYGSAATADSQITWVSVGTALTLSATASAGTYYIYKKWTADSNHTNSQTYTQVGSTYTLTRSKATPTMTLENTDATFHNTAKVTGTASVAGTIYWGTTSSTSNMTNTQAVTAGTAADLTTRTAVGSTTVYAYFIPTDTTNYNSLGSSSNDHASKTMTVSQASDASVSMTTSPNAAEYGVAITLVSASDSSSHGTSEAKIGYKLGAATADSQITWVNVGEALSLAATATPGTYYIYKKWTADSNHSNSAEYTQVKTLVREKATLTVVESSYSGTYDGSAHSSTVKVTSSGWDGATIVCGTSTSYGTTVTSSGVTNTEYAVKTATNYTASTTIYYKITGGTNYNDYTDSVTFEINKKTPTLTFAPVSGTLTYNGSTQDIGTITYDGDGTFQYAVTTSNTKPSTGWTTATSGTTIKSSAATATTYYVWLKSAAGTNFAASDPSSNKGTKAIDKATPTMSLSGSDTTYPTAADIKATASVAGKVYWGTTSATSGMGSELSVNASTATTVTSQTTAGTLTVYAYFVPTDTTNYNSLGSSTNDHTSKSVTVSKGTPTFTLSGSDTTYHTTAYIKGNASVAGTIYWGTTSATSGMTNTTAVSAANAGTDVTITSRTNYGTTTVYAYFVPTDSNYNSLGSSTNDHASKSVTVAKATDARVTAALTTGTLTYDGTAKTLATVSSSEGCTYYLGYKLSSAATADDQITWGSANSSITATNAGTYYVYYKFTPDSNHSNSAAYTQIGTTRVIGTATITTSGTGNQSYVYDGSAHGSAISATTVNSQTATIKYGTSSGSYTLTSAPQATNVSDSKTVYWQVTAPNHTTATGSYSLTITARPINITAATDSKVYDGTALTNNTATAEATGTNRGLAPDQTMTSCTVTGTITNVGSTPNVPSGAVIKSGSTDTTANYDITYVNGTLTVTKQSVTITAPALTSGTITYNGANQYLSSTGSTSAGTIYYYVSTSSTTPTFSTTTWSTSRPTGQNAGTYYLWYYVSVDSNNYSGSGINAVTKIGTGSKVINQKALTVTAASDTKVYDGNALTINSAALSGNVSGHTLYSATYGGSQTTVGSSSSTVSDAVIKSGSTDVTDNYAITYANGTLTVTAATFTVSEPDQSYPWTGNAQGSAITVTNLKGSQTATIRYRTASSGDYTLTSAPQITNVSQSPLTVYWQVTAPNHTTQTGSYTITITPKKATLPGTISGDRVDADNIPARATVTKDYTGGTLQYSTDNGSTWNTVTWSSGNLTANPSLSTVGEVSVKFRVDPDGNHSVSDTSSAITLTVIKADDPSVTITLNSTTLTYSGSAQTLATASNAHGIASYYIGYKKGSTATADNQITWGNANATPLQAIDAGKYYVYYKFTADSTHTGDVTYTLVGDKEINKKAITPTVSMSGYTYGGTKATPSVSGNSGSGTVTYYYNTTDSNTGGTAWSTVTNSTSLSAGDYWMYAVVGETSNYLGGTTSAVKFTISKATGSITYNTVTSVSEYCTSTNSAMSQTDANKTVVVATSSASSTTNTGVTIGYTIDSVTKSGTTYTGWTVSSNGQTVTVPQGTAAGTYSVKITATAPTTTNYLAASVQKTVSVVITAVELVSINLVVAQDTIAFGGTTTATVYATYNNGSDPKDVTSSATYSTNPTGIVTIS